MARNDTEHSPLSRFDEYPIHQFPEPLRIVSTTDARAYERYWFTAEDESGEFFLVIGFGVYPNLGTADAYAILVRGQHHTSVRIHRLLGDDRADLQFGPLRAEVVTPFREWRFTLGDNDQDLRFDLRWRDTKRAVFQRVNPYGATNRDGRLTHEITGYESFGRVEGTIEHKGTRINVSRAHVRGSRDHHWGVRNGVGGPGHMEPDHMRSHFAQFVEFGDWSIWGMRCLYNLGDERPGTGRIIKSESKLRFDPETKHLLGGIVTNTFDNGEVKEVHYEQSGLLVAHLRCGMYSGPTKAHPDGDIYHGMYVGDEVVAGRTDDLSDPDVRRELAGFEDHLCIARCGDETTVGILECRDPLLYDMCKENLSGLSLLET
jgi:hypothetical protein